MIRAANKNKEDSATKILSDLFSLDASFTVSTIMADVRVKSALLSLTPVWGRCRLILAPTGSPFLIIIRILDSYVERMGFPLLGM